MTNMTPLKALPLALVLAFATENAHALTVTQAVSGNVSTMSNTGVITPFPGFPWSFPVTDSFYTQMDVTSFSTTGGTLELLVEAQSGPSGTFDPYVYLFEDDGDFSADDLIAYNDDISYGVVLDSYLSETVAAGNYFAIVGQYTNRGNWNGGTRRNPAEDTDYIDFVTGIANGYAYQDNDSWNTLPQNGTVQATYNYEITLTGEDLLVNGVPAVPLPATLPLILAGFAVPMVLKRRAQKRA